MQLTLHGEKHWYSPWVFSVFVTLREKGLDFAEHEVDLDLGEQRRPEYQRRTVTARVPALDHDGFSIAESSAIVEYLEEVFPPPGHAAVLPADLRDRARARQILAWLRSDLVALRRDRPTTSMFYGAIREPLTPEGRSDADKLVRVTAELVAGGRTQLFEQWSIADADLGFCLHRLILNGHEVPAGVRAFAEVQWGRGSVRGFVEHARPGV